MLKLRPFQQAALANLENPGHVLCVAPTGSGKSLIYERAAARPGRRTLLVTPLVALARQQHARLRAGFASGAAPEDAVKLGAGRDAESPPEAMRPGVWIVSPEKLQSEAARAQLRRWRPNFLVVDECHCLWEWGDRFRPAFAAVPGLLAELSIRSSLWLTATLPPEARAELRARLAPAGLIELGGFDLPPRLELRVARVPWAERAEALVGWARQQRDPGIVFVSTRETARRLQRLLEAAGLRALAYHAGLGTEERGAIEAGLELPDVVVATSAFGMGMDYPRLQWAALWQAPSSLLSLAQAIGRAGRDPAKPSRALVLWADEDLRLLEWTVQGSERRARQLAETRAFLSARACRRTGLRGYFEGAGLGREPDCGACDFCGALGEASPAGTRIGVSVCSALGAAGADSVQIAMT